MNLRSLRFFLAVAENNGVQKAAESLHLTQPNISRAFKALEEELNAQLFVRTARGVEITEEGELLRMRAEEILSLVDKTKAEFVDSKGSELSGEVRIAAGESEGMRNVIRAMSLFKAIHPKVEFSVTSGNSANVAYQLNVGLSDLGIVFDPFDVSKYEYTRLPWKEDWCVYLRKDDPLAEEPFVTPQMLRDRPLILSAQTRGAGFLKSWLGRSLEELNVVAYFTLINTPKLMVEEGLGLMISFDNLIDLDPNGPLMVKPLSPKLHSATYLIRKKEKVLSRAAQAFHEYLKDYALSAEAAQNN
jgi:transcriptional regulator, lysR family